MTLSTWLSLSLNTLAKSGALPVPAFLAQEDGSSILQEDGAVVLWEA